MASPAMLVFAGWSGHVGLRACVLKFDWRAQTGPDDIADRRVVTLGDLLTVVPCQRFREDNVESTLGGHSADYHGVSRASPRDTKLVLRGTSSSARRSRRAPNLIDGLG